MNFGGRIKLEREARGITQAALAALAGLPAKNGQQTIGALEERDSKRSEHAPALAVALALRLEWALTGTGEKYLAKGNGHMLNATSESNAQPGPDTLRQLKKVPVVGRAKCGDNGFLEEEQYPVGHGDGYLLIPTRDGNAFGLLMVGTSMEPRYRHGDYAVAEPNATYGPGDDVYVALHDGRKMVKVLAWERADSVRVTSLNDDHPPMVFSRDEIAAIYACNPVPKRWFVPD